MPVEPGHKGTIADRFEKLDRTGRRCFGSAQRCERNAAYILTLVEVDPATGDDRGEPEDRKACPRHRKFYGEDIRNGYRILAVTDMPPLEPFGGSQRAENQQRRRENSARSRQEEDSPPAN